MLPVNLENLLASCLEAMRKAEDIVRENWIKPRHVRHKGRIDLVTETDFAVQKLLRQEFAAILPEAVFVGEENDAPDNTSANADNSLCWIVDPVDGTTNFVHHIPMVGISAALCSDGRPILGIVSAPMLHECYYASKGGGAFVNGLPIHVSDAENASDTLVATGFPYDPLPIMPQIMSHLGAVIPATQGLRRLGAASLDLAWVACGRLDAFYEHGLKPWDMAAGWLLVEEAGGRVSDCSGRDMKFGEAILASNGMVHAAMLELLGR